MRRPIMTLYHERLIARLDLAIVKHNGRINVFRGSNVTHDFHEGRVLRTCSSIMELCSWLDGYECARETFVGGGPAVRM